MESLETDTLPKSQSATPKPRNLPLSYRTTSFKVNDRIAACLRIETVDNLPKVFSPEIDFLAGRGRLLDCLLAEMSVVGDAGLDVASVWDGIGWLDVAGSRKGSRENWLKKLRFKSKS